jgi:uncharacterized protein YaiL (DUF2058 family)
MSYMAESLQEQLRALGLANAKPERPAGRERQKARSKQPRAPKPPSGAAGEPALDQAYALREQEERREAGRARQKKLAEERRRREINEQIRKIVEADRLNRDDAPLPRNFLYKGRIRKIYVTAEQQQALTAGEMGIVYLTGGYHLLPAGPLEAARGIAADHVVDLDAGSSEDADHPVPDDLVW